MNAFDNAWSIVKALYHGTYWGDEVEREGLTEGAEAADLQEYVYDSRRGEDYDWPIEQIKERFLRDYSEEDWERMMLGDTWKYGAGPTERETLQAPAGMLGAFNQARAYGSDMFEIDENHPDAPEWIREPKWQRDEYDTGELTHYAYPKHTVQWRTKGNVPSHTMRRLGPEELSELDTRLKNWRDASMQRYDWIDRMMWDFGYLQTLTNEQQKELLRQHKILHGMGQVRTTPQELNDWLRANYLASYATDEVEENDPV